MDFRDSAVESTFRAEVREWISRAMDDVPDQRGLPQVDRETWSATWQDRLNDGQWVGITWPEEYGGRGLDIAFQAIFNEESARFNAPYPLNSAGTMLTGPTLLVHASHATKVRFLPKIKSGEEIWCQGFSEPGSGSDLASLTTSASPVDGGWVINGSKIWTSWAHHADRCMLLARTDSLAPRHHGITYFLAPMEKINVRPLTMINGDTEFNQMFLDDVFVADEDVLGDVNDGWEYALTTLAFERGSMALNLWVWARQAVDAVIEVARRRGLGNDPGVMDQIGMLHIDAEAIRVGSLRAMAELQADANPGPESSALKLLWTWTMQNATRLGVQLAGAEGLLLDDAESLHRFNRYLRARAHSIEGGSDEIQKSILAERVLQLPRSR